MERDETETLRRIIVDCVDSDLRYCQQEDLGVGRRDIGWRIAREVLRRLESAQIEVISR